jgi:hypothetical protein
MKLEEPDVEALMRIGAQQQLHVSEWSRLGYGNNSIQEVAIRVGD